MRCKYLFVYLSLVDQILSDPIIKSQVTKKVSNPICLLIIILTLFFQGQPFIQEENISDVLQLSSLLCVGLEFWEGCQESSCLIPHIFPCGRVSH